VLREIFFMIYSCFSKKYLFLHTQFLEG